MKKLFIIIPICLLFSLGIIGIIIKNKKEESTLPKIKVAEVTHSVFYVPWYIALENGYFNDEGLDIEVILSPGADKTAATVLSNDVNIGFSGPEATIYVYNNGEEDYLVSFSALTKRDGQFLVGPCEEKDKFDILNLKGETVLAGRSAGMPLMVFNYALKESGIKKGEVIIDDSVDFSSLTGAFISKQGKYVNLFEPNALKIEKENYGCVLSSLGLLSGEVPYTTFYARKSYIENNPKIIKSFIKAINRGLKYTVENDEYTLAKNIINQFPDMSESELATIIKRYKEADSWWENTYIKEEAFDRLQDIMIYNDALKEKVNFDKLINNSFN